jgi:2'-deoxynucleoside 5'-phosphate N-hydrolase
MKIFIGIKYDEKTLVIVPEIKRIITMLGHTPYCFATDEEKIDDEKELMKRAFQKIDESDLIMFEASNDSFGVGIEAGYAFSKGMKIITIMSEAAKISRTLKGVSNGYITYKELTDLEEKLRQHLF